jgi:hypothetical protein
MTMSGIYSTLGSFVAFAWKFFAGGIVVLAAFSSNFFDLKQPHLSVEITEIEQKTSEKIDISALSEFANLRKIESGSISSFFSPDRKYTVEEMQQLINREKQRLDDQKQDLQKDREALEKLPQTPPKAEGEKVAPSALKARSLPSDPETDTSHPSYEAAKKRIDDRDAKLQEREKHLAAAEAEVKNYRETAAKNAKIIVTAAVSNAGDGATTLKPQALLRADLGQGNYLDINVKIAKYEGSGAEIKARGTSVLSFESQPLSHMAPDDQERFTNFFKNTSPTNLFVVDVRGGYHESNTIPFAQGIYEQKIYDGLKAFASKHH